MDSTERTQRLSALGRQIAIELRKLEGLRPWTFVEPTENTYSVYLRNAGDARIYIEFDGYNEPKRLTISGWLHIGKNRSYVDVYENGERVFVPSITVALSRGCEVIAKEIARRFLPEYLRIFALAQQKVAKEIAHDTKLTQNLERMARVVGVKALNVSTSTGRVNTTLNFRTGESQYHHLSVSDDAVQLALDVTLEQAETILRFLTKRSEPVADGPYPGKNTDVPITLPRR